MKAAVGLMQFNEVCLSMYLSCVADLFLLIFLHFWFLVH